MGKVQLKVWISEELDGKLRELIAQKYKKYEKGLLSYEVEQALQTWLALHVEPQTVKSWGRRGRRRLQAKAQQPPTVEDGTLDV
jgi:hypothetical protein